MKTPKDPTRSLGFTLIELVVVVAIIGLLAAIAIPMYARVVEKGRMAEAFTCITAIKTAQDRYMNKNSLYTSATSDLDVVPPTTKFFTSLGLTGTTPNYTVTLTRQTPVNSYYGAFVVSYIGPAGTFLCSQANCQSDLLP